MCGYIPEIPSAPETYIIANQVIIDWTKPNENGSPITSYRISIRQKDGEFTEQLTYCDGMSSAIVTATQCMIPILILETSPYSLELGDSIFARVTATNEYGESA